MYTQEDMAMDRPILLDRLESGWTIEDLCDRMGISNEVAGLLIWMNRELEQMRDRVQGLGIDVQRRDDMRYRILENCYEGVHNPSSSVQLAWHNHLHRVWPDEYRAIIEGLVRHPKTEVDAVVIDDTDVLEELG